jgi:hypothetical protein
MLIPKERGSKQRLKNRFEPCQMTKTKIKAKQKSVKLRTSKAAYFERICRRWKMERRDILEKI